jgi:hypothetical protein
MIQERERERERERGEHITLAFCSFACKYHTRRKALARDKHSSLFVQEPML